MSPKNIVASVRQRLMNHAKSTGEAFNLILVRYGHERLLYRLSVSPHKHELILKGGSLFYVWTDQLHRPTKDLDFLGSGRPDVQRIRSLFADIISIEAVDDGLTFDQDNLVADEIKEDQQYEGIRVKLTASLGNARIHLQADIGFGDATVPPPVEVEYPTLLGFPQPRLRAYAKETVVAEKLEAMVDLGFTNSRMKDFYDLHRFAEHFDFDGRSLANAITSTFQRRQTSIPGETPTAFTSEFFQNDDKNRQWTAFASKLQSDQSLEQVVTAIADFVVPCLSAIRSGVEFNEIWRGETWIHKTRET